MQNSKIVVFAYNFPHKKTQDFLLRLFVEGYRVQCIIAADPVALHISAPSIRTKVRHGGLINPSDVARAIDADYYVLPHNSQETTELLKSLDPDLGIIAGARILKKHIIDLFGIGIINFHPGLIPESRGLDAMLWSIYKNIPLGVTAHLINEDIDAGFIILRRLIPVYNDDTILDLSERLYETQLDLLKPSIDLARQNKGDNKYPNVPRNTKMSAELERAALDMVPGYVRHFAEKI